MFQQWHTFWNADDEPCEIIEVISPAGFESYFREVSAAWGDVSKFAEINRSIVSIWTLKAFRIYANALT